jgi:hypothetical protein
VKREPGSYWFGDTLDVVTKNLTVTFSSAFAKSLSQAEHHISRCCDRVLTFPPFPRPDIFHRFVGESGFKKGTKGRCRTLNVDRGRRLWW